jgi:hypothetical protein
MISYKSIHRYLPSLIFLGVLGISIGCQNSEHELKHTVAMTKTEDSLRIVQCMVAQEKSWNDENIDAFMIPYWHSDSLLFIGKRGLTRGWQATLDNYKKSYPNPEAMGTLRFTNLEIEIWDNQRASVIGKWELLRTHDTLAGHYSLIWEKKMGQWFIVSDHSS